MEPVNAISPAPSAGHLELGRRGEELAAAFLQQNGYRLVAANMVIPIGRNRLGALTSVELDLVAYEGETLCFVEVKTRGSAWFAEPQVNVDRRKQRQVARAARAYRRMFAVEGKPYRFDVVTVIIPDETPLRPKIELMPNFWTENLFRKRFWSDFHYH